MQDPIVDQTVSTSYTYNVEVGNVALQLWVELAPSEVVVRWLPTSLGAPYPGANAFVEPPILTFRDEVTGSPREVSLATMRLIGLEGHGHMPGQPMPRRPLSVHLGLTRGRYSASLRLTTGDAASRTTCQTTHTLGSIDIPTDLNSPRHAPLNEAYVRRVPHSVVEAAQVGDRLVIPSAFSPEAFFARELASGARALLVTGYCPWQTTHLPPEQHPAPPGTRSIGELLHERGLGFYSESLARAGRLADIPLVRQAATYAARMLAANVCDAPWGGKWWALVGFGETDNALHAGICSIGLFEAFQYLRDPLLLHAAASVLEAWPYDANESAPMEVLDSRAHDGRGTFVYNQRLHMAVPMYLVGKRLGHAELMRKGEQYVRMAVLPAMRADGDWPYLRGGQPSPHYTILLMRLLAMLAWEPEWSDDPALRHALRLGAQHALERWCWQHEDRDGGAVLWSDVYAGERRPQLALAKACGMAAVMGFLTARVDSSFMEPLVGTLRGIYAERSSSWLTSMGLASWFHTSVLAPLLDLRLHGYRFNGDGDTLASLQVEWSGDLTSGSM